MHKVCKPQRKNRKTKKEKKTSPVFSSKSVCSCFPCNCLFTESLWNSTVSWGSPGSIVLVKVYWKKTTCYPFPLLLPSSHFWAHKWRKHQILSYPMVYVSRYWKLSIRYSWVQYHQSNLSDISSFLHTWCCILQIYMNKKTYELWLEISHILFQPLILPLLVFSIRQKSKLFLLNQFLAKLMRVKEKISHKFILVDRIRFHLALFINPMQSGSPLFFMLYAHLWITRVPIKHHFVLFCIFGQPIFLCKFAISFGSPKLENR